MALAKIQTFDPVSYSKEENLFLHSHLGQPPIVAMRECPRDVNPRAVQPMLEAVYELVELENHRGVEWTGIKPIQDKITVYLEQSERWQKDRRRGAPRFPSMYSFDEKGRPHSQGPGSDAQKVSTYFLPDGSREKFEIRLVPDGIQDWKPDWAATDQPKTGLKVDADNRRIECLICGHCEKYNPDSRASFNAARARISKHLRRATEFTSAHRELHTNEFGATS